MSVDDARDSDALLRNSSLPVTLVLEGYPEVIVGQSIVGIYKKGGLVLSNGAIPVSFVA